MGGLLFEIPTGAFADIFGRKSSVIAGVVTSGVIFLIIPNLYSFAFIAVFFFLYSAAKTFITGADEAWLVDYLKQKNKEDLLTQAIGRRRSFNSIGTIIALAVASVYVSIYPMAGLWYLSSAVLFTLGLFLFFFGKESLRKEESLEIGGLVSKNIRTSFNAIEYSRRDKSLRLLMMIFLFMSVVGTITLLWQPFMKELNMPLAYIGLIYAIYSIIAIVLPHFIGSITGKLGGERKSLIAMSIATLIIAVMISQSASWQMFVALWCLVAVSDVLFAPVSVSFFQKNTPTKMRATISSVRQMVAGIGGAITPAIVGFIADAYGVRIGILFCSAFMLVIIFLYSRLDEGHKARKTKK